MNKPMLHAKQIFAQRSLAMYEKWKRLDSTRIQTVISFAYRQDGKKMPHWKSAPRSASVHLSLCIEENSIPLHYSSSHRTRLTDERDESADKQKSPG